MPNAMTRRAGIAAMLSLLPLLGVTIGTGAAENSLAATGKPVPDDRPRYADADRCRAGSWFRVENAGQDEIAEVYLRPAGTIGSWGEDRLGEDVLRPRQWLRLDPGQGVFDLLVIRTGGQAFTAQRINPCRIEAVMVSGERIEVR